MKLRVKVFLFTVTTLSIFFVITYLVLSNILTANFQKLEKSEAQKNVSRTVDALQGDIEDLSIKLVDWSQWDDTYAYVQDGNQDYIDSNLQNETFSTLRINFIIAADEDNNVIFKKYVDRNGKEGPFPETLAKYFNSPSVPSEGDQSNIRGYYKGVLTIPEGPVVVVSQGVTSSDRTAPLKGVIGFGYFIDDTVLGQLSSLTHLRVSYSPYAGNISGSDFEEPRRVLAANNPIFVENPKRPDVIAGYALVTDVFGKPAIILRSEMDRDIFASGKAAIAMLAKFILIVATFFIGIVFFLFEFLVIRRIFQLNREVQKISFAKDQSTQLAISGNDEFSQLGREVNKMLGALYTSEIEKKETEERFRTLANSAPVIIWMADASKGYVYANKTMLELTGRTLEEESGMGWTADLHPDDKQKIIAAYEQAFERRQPFDIQYRLRRTDGTYRWFFVQAIPNLTSDGTFLGYLGSGIDVTLLEEADKRKQNYIKEIEQMNEAMVARELKMTELKKEIDKLKKNTGSDKDPSKDASGPNSSK
jgi:PAS domain S-box-containing protein